ncbi:glycoside hydrolase [Fomitiporia mediterranea MF3/22]|uniref:glycoside hydrolase n=1 Tax=Fomitiporia mediterranea (strain MF3/22) TaxID=694068 RepID=UPI0004408400|nr:glycoside hydrolase [Fomitiporia mediterranea MF3/22]EJD08278.1 glycoside hydrolase [Fomitiporia mediterranea MF3/22]
MAAAPVGIAGAAATAGSVETDPLSGGSKEGGRSLPGGGGPTTRGGNNRRRLIWLAAAVGFLVVAAAVALPVGLIVGRRDNNKNKSDSGSGSDLNPGGTDNPPNVAVISGGDGSTVTTEDGSTFTYVNKFGGFWVDDPKDPFNNNAQPNSWTPPLNTSWRWGIDRVYGVNLGGLFVLEPFIVPSLFQKYQNGPTAVVDEWTLSQAMAADTSPGGGLSQIEDHYNTFITEEDIAQIAGAGLNWIRLPIPFWAVDKWDTPNDQEPFLARTCWKYILRVFRWCRKYGLRINLDLHTAPGSQNGYNHSGKNGQIDFLAGVMGYANAQRMLGYIRIITEFISQPEYEDLIPMFGIINEPRTQLIGDDVMSHFYLQAYDIMRGITGIGEGKGPFMSIHDGFEGPAKWAGFLPGSDRIAMDWHPYFAFNGQPNLDPIGVWPARACSWGDTLNTSQTAFGVTMAGEMSNAINDCGLYVNGVPGTGHSYGGDCSFWEDSSQWNQTIKDGLHEFALASFDALQDWFFWTWKIGNSSLTNTVQSPLWSYKAGLEGGWMPTDPRSAVGVCASLGVTGAQFPGTYSAWQTGGSGAGTIDPVASSQFAAWPPPTMSGVDAVNMPFVPTYTATGTVSTLPPDTFTDAPKTVSVGDGWANSGDTSGGVTEVGGCTYPNPWDSAQQTMPTTTCTGAAGGARLARRTPPPTL